MKSCIKQQDYKPIYNCMKSKSYLIIIALFMLFTGLYGQDNIINNLINDFTSTDWNLVSAAKEDLENLQANALSNIMELLKNDNEAKLINTGDLIYPGAEKFYGHGQMIDYDIDNLTIRAGWLLEDLTFENFGFSGVHIQGDQLLDFIKLTFPEYYNNSQNRKNLANYTETGLRQLIKKLSVEKANQWYILQGNNWNRLNALADALKSYDEKRQVKALFYMRNGKTECSGLDKESYKTQLEESVENLSKVEIKRISENAKLILLDDKYDWISMKKAD